MRILKLPRTTPVGSLIYRLKASAAQDKALRFMVGNGTDVNLITIKSVDFYQANVYLNKHLQENEYNFTIYVTDGVERTLVDCQIVVKNGSQLMTSSFIHFRPLLSVPESASFNSTIGYIHVKEKDNSNLPVTFEIEGSDCFGIRYIFGPKGTSKAEIYLKTQLDFERQNLFRLQVYALNAWTNETFDTRNIVMKDLIITVINEQDTPPVFKNIPHLIQLTEVIEQGDIVLTLNAVDGDQEQDRKIKYYLKQVNADTGDVILKSTLDKLREFVGHENLFSLQFVAKEIEQEGGSLTARKIDSNSELEHIVGSLNAESDLPAESDMHNHYIVNDNFYDDEIQDHQTKPIPSSLTSDLLAVDSKISNRLDNKLDHHNDFSKRTDRMETLEHLQRINDLVLNRKPLKSTPINIPPLVPSSVFRKRMLNVQNQTNFYPFNSFINLTTTTESIENSFLNFINNNKPIYRPAIQSPTMQPITAKSFPVTTKLGVKSPTSTVRPVVSTSKQITSTARPITSTISTTKSTTSSTKSTTSTTAKSTRKPTSPASTTTNRPSTKKSSSISSNLNENKLYIKSLNAPVIKNSSFLQHRYGHLINDNNLVADEHYIVNNLTSIGLMDDNFKPENLIEPESSAESSRLNSERATMMNAVLNELSSTSRTETDIDVGFIILQVSNNPPEFPSIRPNYTNRNELVYTLTGQIDDDSKPNSLVQLEQDLIIQDQDHGLNGTFDVKLVDQTNTFDIQPKTGYRNQTFLIQLLNANKLRSMENKQFDLKIIVTDRSPLKPLKSELSLFISVLGTNDNFPQFTQDFFRASINEKEQIGTVITTITAVDQDSGDYGLVTYSHLLGELSSNLLLNKTTGDLTLISLDNIDREKQTQYTLIIYVCDNHCKPDESNSNQTLLIINILDFNDNRPEFPVPRYDYLINSNLFNFSSPIQVQAFDADEPNTPNSNITYEITDGNFQSKFKIDKTTGEIELLSPITIEGSEMLPILDLENVDDTENEKDENDIGYNKNRLIDYPWTEDSFDLAHLDSLLHYYSPIINLTIRAHDQGIPPKESYINVYIHCQNYLNRTAVFIVNDSEAAVKRKKQEYERYLSEMASGRVRIKTIQESPPQINQPNRTLVYSTITYPAQSVVNVNKVNWYSAKILGSPPNMLNAPGGWPWLNLTGTNRQGRNQIDSHPVKTASLDSNSLITWLLITIILIALIFLVMLIAIWCYFCGCRKRKNKINSADSANYYNHNLKQQQMSRQLLKHQQLENDSIDSQTDVKQLMVNGRQQANKQRLSASSQRNGTKFYDNNYQMNEFDAAAFQNKFKKRIKPGSAVPFENAGYVSDADPSGNFILTTRKPRSAPDHSSSTQQQHDTYVDDTGVFASNKVNYVKGMDDVQNSPLETYNEDAYSILNRAWFGERGEKRLSQQQNQLGVPSPNQQDQLTVNQNKDDLYATVKRNKVKFKDERISFNDVDSSGEETSVRRLSQDETSVKYLQDKHRTASQLTLRSQLDQIESSDSKDQESKQVKNAVNVSSDTDSGIGHKDGQKENEKARKDSTIDSIIKNLNNNGKDNQQQKPPTPPPLPLTSQLQHVPQKLHLKNEDVAQKKSVFTIAYNGVKVDRLNSADSSTMYI